MFIFKDKEVLTDTDGYLLNYQDWHPDMIATIAKQESLHLTDEHLEIIHFVREFYLTFNNSPAIRMLVKALEQKYGKQKGNSTYLFKLFPNGPAKQATKLAGLPKPVKCL